MSDSDGDLFGLNGERNDQSPPSPGLAPQLGESDIDRSSCPKKIMKTTSLHLQFFCVIIMKVGCQIREFGNREINATQRAIKMFRNVEQGLRDRKAFPLPEGVAASQLLKQSYFCLANGGETAYAEFCVGMSCCEPIVEAIVFLFGKWR